MRNIILATGLGFFCCFTNAGADTTPPAPVEQTIVILPTEPQPKINTQPPVTVATPPADPEKPQPTPVTVAIPPEKPQAASTTEKSADYEAAFTPRRADWWHSDRSRTYTYQSPTGEMILSNKAPILTDAGKAKQNPTIADLVFPEGGNSRLSEYKYKSATEFVESSRRVTIPAKDKYQQQMCKIGDVLVQCYRKVGVIPARTYTQPETKSVRVSHRVIIAEAKKAAGL